MRETHGKRCPAAGLCALKMFGELIDSYVCSHLI